MTATLSAAADAAGGEMVGLAYRLKAEDRIAEKITGVVRETDFDPNRAAGSVIDSLRYTMRFDDSAYTRSVGATIDRLRAEGFEVDRFRNYWGNDTYQGINAVLRDPDGYRFELQFHTQASFDTKQAQHGIYEAIRTTTDPARRRQLRAEMRAMQRAVTMPLEADRIAP